MLSSSSAPDISPEEYRELVAFREAYGPTVAQLQAEVAELRRQLDWFKKQLFGPTSERRLIDQNPRQLWLGEGFDDQAPQGEAKTEQVTYTRKLGRGTERGDAVHDSGLRFDKGVPVEVVEIPNRAIEGLGPEEYEVIAEKVTHRLAQRPGSYVILKQVRTVVKIRRDQTLSCPPAPGGVLERSYADVGFIAGLLIDKFLYHLPLYRQHQRLRQAGITVSRGWLTQVVHRSAQLLGPIHEAQLESIRSGRVKAVDETPIKVGRTGRGKMKQGYYWPIYGERDELSFVYCPSRATRHLEELLQDSPGVLLSDGYHAYERYAAKTPGITHAQCWAHTRRTFIKAERAEPDPVRVALEHIGALYAHERQIRELGLTGQRKKAYREQHSRPVVEAFFAWAAEQLQAQGLLPSNPLTKALTYALERRTALEVYLADPDVPIDTNHLERGLRPIPMGRKNWMFCWTEVGAEYVGIIQSLLATCRLHGVNPYDYLVDVLQRIDRHPARDVAKLTPRLWKKHYADNPLRSVLHQLE